MPTNVIQVRAATRRDAPSLAALHAEAWRGAYRGIIPHLPLERMIARRGQAWWERALDDRYPLLLLDFGGSPQDTRPSGEVVCAIHQPKEKFSNSTCILFIRDLVSAGACSMRPASACSIVATGTL